MTSLAAITLETPAGSAWEFLVLFLVVISGRRSCSAPGCPG